MNQINSVLDMIYWRVLRIVFLLAILQANKAWLFEGWGRAKDGRNWSD
jgi:hypothetical protein